MPEPTGTPPDPRDELSIRTPHSSPSRHRPTSRAFAALTALACCALLAGCALSEGSGLSPTEARDAFLDVIDRTQSVAGGTWERQDDPTPRSCTVPLWAEGQRYPALRLAPAPDGSDERDEIVEEVTQLWRELGYRVEVSSVGGAVELKAHESRFESLILRLSPNGMTLQGESECRPAE
ncbi:hypothetical protein [Ruicaihuangia caeni]|uniref:Lipoprotein n=1 Tax=Ruicaihuangia caeni TaxID=3042517 RepID=A0AAW6T9B8_9MICO|nr:hypothetical protein [Klugiella sp. YN-L-19]MDI2097742.1 hypothetical protein [Klugiella sp. YN-L-19]